LSFVMHGREIGADACAADIVERESAAVLAHDDQNRLQGGHDAQARLLAERNDPRTAAETKLAQKAWRKPRVARSSATPCAAETAPTATG
jgi:hypothetical protein